MGIINKGNTEFQLNINRTSTMTFLYHTTDRVTLTMKNQAASGSILLQPGKL